MLMQLCRFLRQLGGDGRRCNYCSNIRGIKVKELGVHRHFRRRIYRDALQRASLRCDVIHAPMVVLQGGGCRGLQLGYFSVANSLARSHHLFVLPRGDQGPSYVLSLHHRLSICQWVAPQQSHCVGIQDAPCCLVPRWCCTCSGQLMAPKWSRAAGPGHPWQQGRNSGLPEACQHLPDTRRTAGSLEQCLISRRCFRAQATRAAVLI